MMLRFLASLAAALGLASPAWAASCDAANSYGFAFASQTVSTLSYGTTYNYTATSGAGATRSFSMVLAQNGLSNTSVNGNVLPAIATLVSGSDITKNDLVIGGVFSGRTASITSSTRVITTTFTFAAPIRELALTVHDIDFTSNQYRDWLSVTGANGASTYTANVALGPAATAAEVGPGTTPFSVPAGQAVGTGASGNNSEDGTLIASFAAPVTSVTIRYGNYPLTGSETTTGQQAMGIAGISFCPMPSVSLAKTSAPATGTYGAFNVPDNDVIYTLTVTNSGGSTVDAGTIVLNDVMPANVTFKNVAFDGTTALPVKLTGSAGVTLSASDISYRQSGSGTFGYSPASGYDPLLAELKITPQGTMAANSTFSVQFKAKIK
ncbi:MAG: hypothetical protein ACKOUT_15955 [Novosphingobium sp.]